MSTGNSNTDSDSAKSRQNRGITDAEIQSELERILVDEAFEATQRVREFLRFVVEETLAGNARQLKGFTIATEVFGRDKDFDAAQDPVVRIQAGQLRRALERYYLIAGIQDRVRIDIPKGSYAPVFTLSAQSSASEITDTVWAPIIERVSAQSWPTVVIRPFRNLTGEADLDYVGDGLATELNIELDGSPDVHMLMYREKPDGEKSLAFPARFEVFGSVRKDGNYLKVTAQLVDVTTNEQIWVDALKSEFDLSNLIRFQERTANIVAAHIAGHHGVIVRTMSDELAQSSSVRVSSYQAILKTYAYDMALSPETYAQAFEALKAAIADDSKCGITRGMLAFLYADNIAFEFFDLQQTPLDEAILLAQQAVTIEPRNQVNRLSLCRLRMLNNELKNALAEVETAIELNPDSLYFMDVIGYHLALLGEWERGVAMISKAIRLNPFYRVYVHFATWLNLFSRAEYDRAHMELDLLLGYGDFWEPLARAATLGQLGRNDEARAAVDDLLLYKPDFAARGRVLIGHSIKFDELKAKVIDGLHKAGLNLDDPPH